MQTNPREGDLQYTDCLPCNSLRTPLDESMFVFGRLRTEQNDLFGSQIQTYAETCMSVMVNEYLQYFPVVDKYTLYTLLSSINLNE